MKRQLHQFRWTQREDVGDILARNRDPDGVEEYQPCHPFARLERDLAG